MKKNNMATENLKKLIFYSRELLKIKLCYERKISLSENFENQKLHRIYKELKKTIARLSSKSLKS